MKLFLFLATWVAFSLISMKDCKIWHIFCFGDGIAEIHTFAIGLDGMSFLSTVTSLAQEVALISRRRFGTSRHL